MNGRARFERIVEGSLYVHLDNGESWEATPEDLGRFRLADVGAVYERVDTALTEVLTDAGLIEGDITQARLNAVRYLVETAICFPDLLDHVDHDGWSQVVRIEKTLQDAVDADLMEKRAL